MSSVPYPLQLDRQYAGPVDPDSVFTTTADRIAYLTNPKRYAGQIVSDLQDGVTYKLNASLDQWISISSTGNVDGGNF